MAFETWPTTLPDSPSYAHEGEDTAGRIDPQETMYPVRNRAFPNEVEQVSFIFTEAQLAIFRTWVETDLNGGGKVFQGDWLTDLGFSEHVARFSAPYKLFLVGDSWRVVFGVELISLEYA